MAVVALGGAAAEATQTPGRVVVALGVSPGGPVSAAQLSDASTLIAAQSNEGSLLLVRLSPDGQERWATAPRQLAHDEPLGVVALGDGSAYVVVRGAKEDADEPVDVMHVRADGSADPGFGQAGVARTSVTTRSLLNRVALAAQSDGRLILASPDGRLIRLLSDGTEDTAFRAPVATGLFTRLVVAVLQDGRVAVNDGEDGLLVLLPYGAPDPSFNGGTPLDTGSPVRAIVPRADGSMDVVGNTTERIDAVGSIVARSPARGDVAFLQPDGGEFVAALLRTGTELLHLSPSLTAGPPVLYRSPAFGGTTITPDPVRHVEWAASTRFGYATFVPHGDGVLDVGLVALDDLRTGRSHDELGIAALRDDGTPDTAYGGPSTPTSIRARSVAQRPLAMDVTVPRAGAVLVQAWDRHHHQLAQGQRIASAAGRVHVALMRMRRAGRIASYSVGFRDLVGINATVTLRAATPGPRVS